MFHLHPLCMLGERECARRLLCDPTTICDPWNLFPYKLHLSSWYILQKFIGTQYCCRICNLGGMLVRIHGKMHCHAFRRNGFTNVQQTNLSGRSILLFSSFRIHKVEIFFRLMRHVTELRNIVSLRPRKLSVTKVKQRRLLMFFLITVKQHTLLILLLATVFCF